MKKTFLTISVIIAIVCLSAYGFISWNDPVSVQDNTLVALEAAVETKIDKKVGPNFFYSVGTRFSGIKKEDIDKARSLSDFIDAEDVENMVQLKSTSVIIIENDEQSDKRASGNSKMLTSAQLKLLQSSSISTNFVIRADFRQMNKQLGALEDNYTSPHLTIVPEKQAAYVAGGMDALVYYLKENSKEAVAFVEEDKLKPAKLYFTVTKEGAISNLKLDRSCGDPAIDAKMVELITNIPGDWEPAENLKGEKVDQELVFSFGLIGC